MKDIQPHCILRIKGKDRGVLFTVPFYQCANFFKLNIMASNDNLEVINTTINIIFSGIVNYMSLDYYGSVIALEAEKKNELLKLKQDIEKWAMNSKNSDKVATVMAIYSEAIKTMLVKKKETRKTRLKMKILRLILKV